MGKTTRKRYSADFKAKVALEAIKGELTLKHGVHQTLVAAWKRQAVEGMAASLSGRMEADQGAGVVQSHVTLLGQSPEKHGKSHFRIEPAPFTTATIDKASYGK